MATETIDLRMFNQKNAAKDFRDKVCQLYDELACVKVNANMTYAERDQAVRRYMRKVCTHALNALQETREEFVRKYLSKYHQKMQEQADIRASR